MRMAAVWMVVVGLATAPAARAEPPGDVRAYAVFGLASVAVASHARVEGDVGSLGAVELGSATRASGAAAAPTIRLRDRARAAGGYFCGGIEGTSESCGPLASAFVAAPSVVLATPGTADVSVRRRAKGASPLPAGVYGTLAIGSAAQMTLAGGSYVFASIALGSRAKLLCAAPCDIAVDGAVTMRQASRLGAVDGLAAGTVSLRIASHAAAVALEAKSRATIDGAVYAPTGDVRLGSAVKVGGGLVGNVVTVGPRARLAAAGAG